MSQDSEQNDRGGRPSRDGDPQRRDGRSFGRRDDARTSGPTGPRANTNRSDDRPGSVGTTTARNLIAPLMATGPALIGTTGTAAHVVQIPVTPDRQAGLFGQPDHAITTVVTDHVMTDHAVTVVRATVQNSTALLTVTVRDLVGITTVPSLIGLPMVTVREVVAGTMTAQNSTALLTVIGPVLIGMIGLIAQPVPDHAVTNQPVHHASTGKIVRTSAIGMLILPALRTIEAVAMIVSVVIGQNGRTARMGSAHG